MGTRNINGELTRNTKPRYTPISKIVENNIACFSPILEIIFATGKAKKIREHASTIKNRKISSILYPFLNR
tara:strand:- start:187 stop:399 length:213 start_codon:yes stop_codon:yes gene_type:complete